MALTRKSIPSPNYSSRGGASVRLIVLHTAEGAKTYQELGNFFASSSSGVSSHVGIDDTRGVIGEYVKRQNKAWTQGNANSASVSAELCAFAKWTSEWDKHPDMIRNAAAWVAEECAYFDIPITKLTASQAQGSGRGVCQHADLGSWGGGHWDCGPAFPMDRVLEMARGGGENVTTLPDWFWSWSSWYLTTDRDPDERPAGTPKTIPDWAWTELDQVQRIGNRYGMTNDERSWIDWYAAGKKGKRPAVPQTIPDRWWDDQAYVVARDK